MRRAAGSLERLIRGVLSRRSLEQRCIADPLPPRVRIRDKSDRAICTHLKRSCTALAGVDRLIQPPYAELRASLFSGRNEMCSATEPRRVAPSLRVSFCTDLPCFTYFVEATAGGPCWHSFRRYSIPPTSQDAGSAVNGPTYTAMCTHAYNIHMYGKLCTHIRIHTYIYIHAHT